MKKHFIMLVITSVAFSASAKVFTVLYMVFRVHHITCVNNNNNNVNCARLCILYSNIQPTGYFFFVLIYTQGSTSIEKKPIYVHLGFLGISPKPVTLCVVVVITQASDATV